MPKWEYYCFIGNAIGKESGKKVGSETIQPAQEYLHRLGLDGWELASTAPFEGHGWGTFLYTLKRQLANKE